MKKFTFFAIIILIACSFNLNAQTTDYKWAFGINWQYEDFNTVHLAFPDQFTNGQWQGYSFPSAISVGKNLNRSFNVFGQFGISQLDYYIMKDIKQDLSSEKFWTGDLNLAYKFTNGYILKELCWFDPYVYLGIGVSDIKDLNADKTTYFKQVTGIGINFWLTEKAGLNFQAAYDYMPGRDLSATPYKYDNYTHYTFGVKFRFGSKDTDGDGVKDKDDLCPETPGKIELAGCPDKDNDGITDKADACPDVAGKPEFKGCPDTDGDGVTDSQDACPNSAGKKELGGCPDRDNDGIADKDDKCPDQAGMKELGGCPDRDSDGIADNEDACPDTKGLAKFNGCPDRDGDGIPDDIDKCPDVFGVAANNGCPEVKNIELTQAVYFMSNKSEVTTQYSKEHLDEVVAIMKEHPEVSVMVEGYADSRESKKYNIKLSEKRANYVIYYLVKSGIAKKRLIKKFYGEDNPVADNKTEEGRAKNRRVEIKTVK